LPRLRAPCGRRAQTAKKEKAKEKAKKEKAKEAEGPTAAEMQAELRRLELRARNDIMAPGELAYMKRRARVATAEAAAVSTQKSKTGGARDDAGWEGWLAKLKKYKAAHGDCKVPQRWAEDPGLGSWVHNQRGGDGVTAERAAKLEELGFVWEGSRGTSDDAKWEAQLARLVAYKAAHGDCNVPQGWAEDPRLATWVNHQRQLKRKLDRGEYSEGMTAERVARLTALGFAWEGTKAHPNEAKWEAQLARLAAHKVAHGDCNVPQGWAEDPGLGSWVSEQRARKRKLDRGEPSKGMTAARAAKLEALGLTWDLLGPRRG
jgi:hypothetical protein